MSILPVQGASCNSSGGICRLLVHAAGVLAGFSGLRVGEVTRAALELAEKKVLEDAQPLEDNVVSLASRRR